MSLDRKLLDNFLPEGFETQNLDGYKENFDADRIRTGFDKDTLEILSGPNLNNFLDKTGKNFNVLQEVMQFLKDMPIGCFPFINASNQLDYKNISSFFRNVGEIVYSSVPLDDDNLHLADGSIIEGNGKYRRFVKYMVDLMNDYPSLFVTNEVYNTTVNKYGVCGKYVYDSQSNTLRLPTYTGIMEATLDSSALGNVVEAGVPNIKGTFGPLDDMSASHFSGAFYYDTAIAYDADSRYSSGGWRLGFDANRSNPVYGRLQPGAKNQVQPQTVKVYPYVVLSIDESQKQQLTAVYVYQGSVPTKDDLPKEGNVLGHVYNVEYDGFMYGQNYAWNGEDWDPLGGIVDLSKYFTKIEVSNQFATKLSLESNVDFLQGQISQNRADINTLDAGGVISKTPSKLKAAVLLATVMDKPQSDIEIFNILMDKKRSTFDRSKFNVVGSPTITDDGIASGFSNTSYLRTTSITLGNKTVIHGCFTATDTPVQSRQIRLFDTTSGNSGSIYLTSNYIQTQIGSVWSGTIVTSRYQQNIPIYYTFTIENESFSCQFMQDGVELGTLTGSGITGFAEGNTMYVELGKVDLVDTYGNHTADLKQFSITIDGVEVFNCNKTGTDQIKNDNYTNPNNVPISQDGIIDITNEDFTSITIPTLDLSNPSIVFKGSFIKTGNVTKHSAKIAIFHILSATNETNTFIRLTSNNNDVLNLQIMKNNSYVYNAKIGDIVRNKKYFVEYRYVADRWVVTIKDELNVIISYKEVISDYNLTNSVQYFPSNPSQYGGLVGYIDLNDVKVYSDYNLVYQPTLRIPYTLSKINEKIVDATYRDRVQDMYEQFGYTHYYTIGDEPEKYNVRVVGNPTLVGGVASGFSSGNYPVATNIVEKLNIATSFDIFAKIYLTGVTRDNIAISYLTSGKISNCSIRTNGSIYWATYFPETGAPEVECTLPAGTFKFNQEQYIRLTYKDGKAYVSCSSDKINWISSQGVTSSGIKNAVEIYGGKLIGLRTGLNSGYNESTFIEGWTDLSEFRVEVDGKEVFRGYEPAITDAFTLATHRNCDVIESYYGEDGFSSYELTADLSLMQTGSAMTGQTVNLKRNYRDNKYICTKSTSAKTASSFTPAESGTWITKGLGVLG